MNKKVFDWIIAIIAAILYLTVSIIFDSWEYSWFIWVVYAIYRFIDNSIINHKINFMVNRNNYR